MTAAEFSFTIAELLVGKEKRDAVAKGTLLKE